MARYRRITRARIGTRTYDIDTARKIFGPVNYSESRHYHKATLYQKRGGEQFIYHDYCTYTAISPITTKDAVLFMSRYCH